MQMTRDFIIKKFYLCIWVLFVFLINGPSNAQESTNDVKTTPPQQKIEIVGNTDNNNFRREDTVTKTIITKEEIEKYGEASIANILNRQPGIVGGQIRGLAGYTQYLIDGQRLSGGLKISDIELSQIERIEIIRSAVAEYSTQGIGGTINIVLKRKVTKEVKKIKLQFKDEGSQFPSSRLTLQFSDKNESTSYDITSMILRGVDDSRNTNLIEEKDILNNSIISQTLRNTSHAKRQVISFSPVFFWKASDNDLLIIRSSISQFSIDVSGFQTLAASEDTSRQIQSESLREYDDFKTKSTQLTWERKLDKTAKLNNTLSIRRQMRGIQMNSHFVDELNGKDTHQKLKHNNDFVTLSLNGNYSNLIDESHEFKSGWNLGRESKKLSHFSDITGQIKEQIEINKYAFFIQDEWKQSEKWSNYLGIRAEGIAFAGRDSKNINFYNRTNVISPIVQSLWKNINGPENQFRFALGKTFNSPDDSTFFNSLKTTSINNASIPNSVGNPNLRPEVSWGLDGTFEHFGKNNLNYSTSIYIKHIKDILRDDIFIADDIWQSKTINDGNALVRGISLDTSFPLKIFFENFKNIELKANLSRNWSYNSNIPAPNNRFASQPKLSANIGIDFTPNDILGVNANFNYVSGGELRTSLTNIKRTQPSRQLSILTRWAINKKLKMNFNVSNLLKQNQNNWNYYFDKKNIRAHETSPTYRTISLTFDAQF
jgi:outer membrane receptor for ferrienterochelin and colicins